MIGHLVQGALTDLDSVVLRLVFCLQAGWRDQDVRCFRQTRCVKRTL